MPYEMKNNNDMGYKPKTKFSIGSLKNGISGYKKSGLGNIDALFSNVETKKPDTLASYEVSNNRMENNIIRDEKKDSLSGYFDKLGHIESTNNYNAVNEGSGAYGKYQFLPGTEKYIAGKLGMSIDEARTPKGQEAMIRRFTQDNKEGLLRHGIEPTNENLWFAHNQGLTGAIRMLKKGEVNQDSVASNLPQGGDATASNYMKQWKDKWNNINYN